ncbi:hypothetical protein [Nocardioides perillae]|uniref:Uncharacterized protein n=1 Tax=Nocardioides perillae TaxID=1119534 RepID=A0A7Y9UKG5_9ACTN|nr:hypothetical protein [Nocardioides perillae]NYG55363.1 hypothetical protein [Nocardioides perillae]
MPGFQRIHVVSTAAGPDDVRVLGREVGRGALVLTAPTGEAKAVARGITEAVAGEARPEVPLAPVRFPDAGRGDRLDALVREHALRDRFRDVVVVADQATLTLLLRALAPDQLADGGPVTVVGLPRADPPVSLRRVAVLGGVVGVLSAGLQGLAPLFALPLATAAVGLVLLAVPSRRHTGREVLLAAALGAVVFVMIVAGSRRFPAA